MAHKHHPKEARIRAVQPQDGGRPASDICKDMNIGLVTVCWSNVDLTPNLDGR